MDKFVYRVTVTLDDGDMWHELFDKFEDAKEYAQSQIWSSETCLAVTIIGYEQKTPEENDGKV